MTAAGDQHGTILNNERVANNERIANSIWSPI
jgi:hypothetical protein